MGQVQDGSRKDGTLRRLRLGLLLGAALALSGCATESVFAVFDKGPDVPKAPEGQFPTFAPTSTIKRPPVLDAKGQARMESDLTNLGKRTQQKGEAAAKEAP